MMEQDPEGTIQYHLGQLTSAVNALQVTVATMQKSVGEIRKGQGGMVTAVAVLAETVKNLPCDERLDSCRTHMIAIEKLCNGKSRVCQSIKNRRSNLVSAAIGGVVVGAVEIIVHLLGVF